MYMLLQASEKSNELEQLPPPPPEAPVPAPSKRMVPAIEEPIKEKLIIKIKINLKLSI